VGKRGDRATQLRRRNMDGLAVGEVTFDQPEELRNLICAEFRCGDSQDHAPLRVDSSRTDRAQAAGESLAGASVVDDSPCAVGHKTPRPSGRSPPASFKAAA